MIFHIGARNKEGTEAYAERIFEYSFIDDAGTVAVRSMKNEIYFADIRDIVINPHIIRKVSGEWLYKIRLGE